MSQPTTRQPYVIDWTSGKPYLPLLEGPPATCGMRSVRVELRQGEEIGEHSTGNHEEVLVIIEGRGEMVIEGHSPLAIRGGQEAYVPPRTRHNVRNAGSLPLRYIYVVAPVPATA